MLLRLATGGSLILGRISIPDEFPLSLGPETHVATVLLGFCLLFGLWTPVTATITALIQLWMCVSGGVDQATHILLVILAISLALLGPGAWSIDARIFGRKRIDI